MSCITYSELKLTNFPLSCFPLHVLINLSVLINWLIIPTSLDPKGLQIPFPSQSLDMGKAVMGDNNEKISLTDVVVAQPTIVDQNEL